MTEAEDIARNIVAHDGVTPDQTIHAMDVVNPQLVTLAKAYIELVTPVPVCPDCGADEFATNAKSLAGKLVPWAQCSGRASGFSCPDSTGVPKIFYNTVTIDAIVHWYESFMGPAFTSAKDLDRVRERRRDIAAEFAARIIKDFPGILAPKPLP